MEITEADVAQIAQWGMENGEKEVCGLLLTRSDGGPRLKMVPNRAENPSRDARLDSEDIVDALFELVGDLDRYPGDLMRDLVVWHTHPGGLVGPSLIDVETRWAANNYQVRFLVVTIPSGEAVYY